MLVIAPHPAPVRLLPSSARRRRAVLRRRRLVVAVTALLLCAGVAMGLHRLATAALAPGALPAAGPRGGAAAVDEAPATVVVQPGDSLWAVARRLQPHGDVRPLVHHLAELNGGGALEVGQVLVVPAR